MTQVPEPERPPRGMIRLVLFQVLLFSGAAMFSLAVGDAALGVMYGVEVNITRAARAVAGAAALSIIGWFILWPPRRGMRTMIMITCLVFACFTGLVLTAAPLKARGLTRLNAKDWFAVLSGAAMCGGCIAWGARWRKRQVPR